jgi:dGTPase
MQSKSFRRLNEKTQVMCNPRNSHVRSRGDHTLEVVSISGTIASYLRLNMNLSMAIAAAHDIGHTPYGHLGEKVFNELSGERFHHAVFGVVVAQEIETKGQGLNLCYETLEGMLNHSRGEHELTVNANKPPEYAVVMYADKIAYTFSDVNDAIRYEYLKEEDLPDCITILGKNPRERNDSCMRALIEESTRKGNVSFSEGEVFNAFNDVKTFMYDNVYHKMNLSLQEEVLKSAYNFISENPEFRQIYPNVDPIVCLALMTDNELAEIGELLLHSAKIRMRDIDHFGVFEILPFIKDKKIDYSNPDLSWAK